MLYTGLVRPVLDYGSSYRDSESIRLQEDFEEVQKRAARFVTGNYTYGTGGLTGIPEQLEWESLKRGRMIVDSYCLTKAKGCSQYAHL